MGIEQKINYQLNKYPKLKKGVKSAYQHVMYAASPKIISEGEITRISPDDPTGEYFFGYYDKSPWDATDRYVLCLRARDTWSDVSPRQTADILLIDTGAEEKASGRVKKLAETRAWNVQQGCMLQWLGPDFSSKILYNDFRNGRYVSVILEIESGTEHIVSMPVYTVSADGKTALTLDFSRLYNLRPGYGYYNEPEATRGIALPDATAVWRIDLESGDIDPLLSYRDFAEFSPRKEMLETGAVHKVNHLMLGPDGKRFMVLYRWFIGERKYTRLITCNTDGTEMYLLSDDDMVSHCFWKNNEEILAFENKRDGGTGYYLMKDKTQEYRRCWPQLTGDGHPSYAPDGKRIVTDSYPDRARIQYLRVMRDENSAPQIIAKVFSPFKYDNDTRCDLHPRWSRSGNKVCFDSVFEGHRGIYAVKVPIATESEEGANESVSVIIPVYNVENYLERCVDSVMRQPAKNQEVILVNDGSTDNSLAVCKKLQEKYPEIIIVDKENGGLSSARNAGLRAAHGTFIGFVDSDDWVASGSFDYMLRLAVSNSADIADVRLWQVHSETDTFPAEEEKIETYSGHKALEHYLYRGMSEQNGAPYSVCRKLFRRDLFRDDTAGFVEGTLNEDICFNFRMLRKCERIVVSNQIKYFYFQGGESISSGVLKQKDLDLLTISRELVALTEESNDERLIELAKMKEARGDFSLLARAAKYGIDASVKDPDALIQTLRKRLQNNIGLLMRSPMSVTRKALAAAFAANYKLSAVIVGKLPL